MIKKCFAVLAIGFAVFVWYMAANAGIREHQDWAPIGAVLYGLVGGVPLMAVGLGTTAHHLMTCPADDVSEKASLDFQIPMVLFLNAGWILTALAVLKVMFLN